MKVPRTEGHLGAGDKCPLCGSTSGVSKDSEGYICLVCGAPRVLVDGAVTRSGSEKPYLESAKALRLRRAGWATTAGVATFGTFVAIAASALLGAFVDLGVASRVLAGAAILGPLAFAVLGFVRARRNGAAARAAMSEAQVAVARDLLRAGGSMDGTELASLLRIPIEEAEQLLSRIQVDRFLAEGSDVPQGRLRVESDAPSEETVEPRKDRTT